MSTRPVTARTVVMNARSRISVGTSTRRASTRAGAERVIMKRTASATTTLWCRLAAARHAVARWQRSISSAPHVWPHDSDHANGPTVTANATDNGRKSAGGAPPIGYAIPAEFRSSDMAGAEVQASSVLNVEASPVFGGRHAPFRGGSVSAARSTRTSGVVTAPTPARRKQTGSRLSHALAAVLRLTPAAHAATTAPPKTDGTERDARSKYEGGVNCPSQSSHTHSPRSLSATTGAADSATARYSSSQCRTPKQRPSTTSCPSQQEATTRAPTCSSPTSSATQARAQAANNSFGSSVSNRGAIAKGRATPPHSRGFFATSTESGFSAGA
jgi:hypothetical protein